MRGGAGRKKVKTKEEEGGRQPEMKGRGEKQRMGRRKSDEWPKERGEYVLLNEECVCVLGGGVQGQKAAIPASPPAHTSSSIYLSSIQNHHHYFFFFFFFFSFAVTHILYDPSVSHGVHK